MTLLDTLQEVLEEAAEKRNEAQAEVNERRSALAEAEAAHEAIDEIRQSAARVDAERRTQHNELLNHYNQQRDKSRLGAIKDKVDRLALGLGATRKDLQMASEQLRESAADVATAKAELAAAERMLEQAHANWDGVNAEVTRLREQQ